MLVIWRLYSCSDSCSSYGAFRLCSCSWYGASRLLVIMLVLVIWRVQITGDYACIRDMARPDYWWLCSCSWYGASRLLVIMLVLVIWRVQITGDYARARYLARPNYWWLCLCSWYGAPKVLVLVLVLLLLAVYGLPGHWLSIYKVQHNLEIPFFRSTPSEEVFVLNGERCRRPWSKLPIDAENKPADCCPADEE